MRLSSAMGNVVSHVRNSCDPSLAGNTWRPQVTAEDDESIVEESLNTLRNLGPRTVQMLASVGISTVGRLRAAGAVAAYVKVRRSCANTNLNLLWTLEGALTDTPWQQLGEQRRAQLLLALEQYEREHPAT